MEMVIKSVAVASLICEIWYTHPLNET